jgi:hypothetical protein
MTMSAMGTEEHVIGSQVRTHSGSYRFLANVRVASAMHQTALMRLRKMLLALANELHRAIERRDGRVESLGGHE